MDEKQKRRKLKITIVVLSILLALSTTVLAGMLIHQRFAQVSPYSVVVPDNIITPEAELSKETQSDLSGVVVTEVLMPPSRPASGGSVYTGLIETDEPAPQRSAYRASARIYLYDRNPGDSTPFSVNNMFPGDVETKSYCVRVSCSGPVTVKFRADVRPGYEKLAEVLKCKVVLPDTGETLYDGLMRDMPESVDHTVSPAGASYAELDYQITAYLDTSVGNEYQNKELIADFRWWVEGSAYDPSYPDDGDDDDDNLGPWYDLIDPPKTGDDNNPALWFGLMIGSLLMLILLFVLLRKKGERNE